MSVQLIIYPQYHNGINALSGAGTQWLVDGYDFATVNSSSNNLSLNPGGFTLVQYAMYAFTPNTPNTWVRFSTTTGHILEGGGQLGGGVENGIFQIMSNQVSGTDYILTIDIAVNNGFEFFQYENGSGILIAHHVILGTGVHTIPYTAQSMGGGNGDDNVLVFYMTGVCLINSITVTDQIPEPLVGFPSNGQVILDLYEDEDIPLTLSVDDFKNAAEKVQSYSKAFKLPATKRNNKIFDNIFEVTRSVFGRGYIFNPYVKTKCELKQDGFILFEGYLRMIDIIDKEGEVSYNVNLYSEVIALADLIGDRTFADLDFTELKHNYNRTEIQNSWFTGTGVTYLNSNDSGFRDELSICYPFVNWQDKAVIADGSTSANANMPQFESLTDIFRPFIQVKYLIDRIFNQPNFPFSYTSAFFDTSEFKKLYMDFNWGSDAEPSPEQATLGTGYYYREDGDGILPAGDIAISDAAYNEYEISKNIPGIGSPLPDATYDWATNITTSNVDGNTYIVNFSVGFTNTNFTGSSANDDRQLHCRWRKMSGATQTIVEDNGYAYIVAQSGGSDYWYQGTFSVELDNLETLRLECMAFDSAGGTTTGAGVIQKASKLSTGYPGAWIQMSVSNVAVTNNTLLNSLRGETGQWSFLKGIMTMFNLVTIPDKSDPSNILIEPYTDVFINNTNDPSSLTLSARGISHDWTDKIDQTEIKLEILTELNKITKWQFAEDEDDAAFQGYKRASGGFLYGSKEWDASTFGSLETLLSGEEEIIAEPFAATVISPLNTNFPDILVPHVYAHNADDGTSEGFDNSPRIMYRADGSTGDTDSNGIKYLTTSSYFVPGFGGVGSADLTSYLQFSHLSGVPSNSLLSSDYHFGECPLLNPVGFPPVKNLFNLYWLPYIAELYNPDTRILKVKVNLTPGDISTFNFYDTVFIKNRQYRVNSIEYKPNSLAVVEFILIP